MPTAPKVWYTSKAFRTVVIIIASVILVGSFINAVILKDNDFRNHYNLGVAFLHRQPYMTPAQPPFCTHYPVGRLMLNATLAIFPYRLARAIFWSISIIALAFSLRLWQRMAQQRRSVSAPVAFAAAVFSLAIMVRWVVRDLDDCGLQILMLYIVTAAAWFIQRHQPIRAGFLVALAATYKTTPILFLPFLLYKRQWRASLSMILAIIALNLLFPMAFLGWQRTLDANRLFFEKSREVAEATRTDPVANGVESPRHINKSLRIAIARYLQTYRPGHPLFIPHPDDSLPNGEVPKDARPHPLFVQFLDLSPATANTIITGILLAFAAILAFLFRHKWGDHLPDADIAPEWAVITALSALLSPLCWSQHLVLLVPAMFLSARAVLGTKTGRWRVVLMWAIAILIFMPQRELIGRNLWMIVQSYKLDTIACLLCILLVLTLPGSTLSPQESHYEGLKDS